VLFLFQELEKVLSELPQKDKREMGQVLSVIEESLGGVRIIKAFNAEETIEKRLKKENDHHQEFNDKSIPEKKTGISTK